MASIRAATASKKALIAAAELVAKAVAARAATFSTEIPKAVRVKPWGDQVFVYVGSRGGQWGWTPIHAWMFEEPHSGSIPKHPLFAHGPRGTDGWEHWYYQPYRPFMEEAAAASADAAMRVYARIAIDEAAAENGFH